LLEQAMVRVLRKMPNTEVQKLQAGLKAVRSRFLYMPVGGETTRPRSTLSDLLIHHMCLRAEALAAEKSSSRALLDLVEGEVETT
jgi:hypothetical protein